MDNAVLAHWHQSIDEFSFSTQEFYERLCAVIQSQKIPATSIDRVNLPEGGFLSGYRDYLRVARGKLTFHICAAPFGVNFFVSWWLSESGAGCVQGCLTTFIPFLGLFARRQTFYEEDTAIMFREGMHAAVVKVLDDILGPESAPKIAAMRAPTVAKSSIL